MGIILLQEAEPRHVAADRGGGSAGDRGSEQKQAILGIKRLLMRAAGVAEIDAHGMHMGCITT